MNRLRAALAAVVIVLAAGAGMILLGFEPATEPPEIPPALVIVASKDGVTVDLTVSAVTGVAVPLSVEGRVAAAVGWPEGFSHGWPGIVVKAPFEGGTVALRMIDGVNRWRIRVDDVVEIELTRPGDSVMTITGLGEGAHVLRAEKLSESWENAVFGGVFAGAVGEAGPEPATRVIEVYGDSDAVGYGVTSTHRDCPGEGVFLATDATQAFAAVAARELDAALELVARSGIGLVRDFSPEGTGGRMIDLAAWGDFAGGPALVREGERIVVVALGANDFEADFGVTAPWADKAALVPDFATALTAFAAERAGPGGRVLLVSFGEYGDELVMAHERALDGLRADGYAAELVVVPEMRRRACDWHMDVRDQAAVAEMVVEAIGRLLGGRGARE
jgi:hypothetical protein